MSGTPSLEEVSWAEVWRKGKLQGWEELTLLYKGGWMTKPKGKRKRTAESAGSGSEEKPKL